MQNTIFKPSALLQIVSDVVDILPDDISYNDKLIRSIDLNKFNKILQDRKYLTNLEYRVLYESYQMKMSTRQIAQTSAYSHSHIASVRSSSISRLAEIWQFFISTIWNDSLGLEDLVDADLKYTRSLTDMLVSHSRKELIDRYTGSQEDSSIFKGSSDFSEEQIEFLQSEIKRTLGLEGILSRQFIENVKMLAAEKFGVDQIELVGSYRRGEAIEESDVDFIILDEKAPYGMEFLKMITFLKDHLGKEVGLLHKNSMIRERDKEIIASMMEDIENYA